jgi:hypothetical protein
MSSDETTPFEYSFVDTMPSVCVVFEESISPLDIFNSLLPFGSSITALVRLPC